MKKTQIALIGYTIRDYCKTAEDFATSMARIKEIGYDAVQISGVGPISEEDIARICGDNGLTICATHEPGQTICESPQAVVDRLGKLDCTYTAYPFPHVPLDSIEAVRHLAAQLDKAGQVLRQAGMTLTYHNHAHEFKRLGDKTALEIIYDETDPQHLQAELDTHWVQTGGCDPSAWCRRMENRLPLLHLKDYVIGEDNGRHMAPVGSGNLDFPLICAAAEASVCQWFIVEQDTDWPDDDPFAAAKASYDYLAGTIAE